MEVTMDKVSVKFFSTEKFHCAHCARSLKMIDCTCFIQSRFIQMSEADERDKIRVSCFHKRLLCNLNKL